MENVLGKNLFILITLFATQFGFGQIGFEENIIMDESLIFENPIGIFTIDIDNDSDQDILIGSSTENKIAWYENINFGQDYILKPIITNEAVRLKSLYPSDIDGDGDIDILSASYNSGEISWYENIDGLGNFGETQVITNQADGAVNVTASDIDNDGDIDVISASSLDNKIAWYENIDGQGTFSTQNIVSENTNGIIHLFPSDVDGDGDIDLFSGTSSGTNSEIAWYKNTDGQGTFSTKQNITSSVSGSIRIYPSDIDNDNDLDLVSASINDDKIAWYENTDGLGNFGIQQIISLSIDNPTAICTSDIDNDGDLDVVSSLSGDDKIIFYENTDGQGDFGIGQVISDSIDYVNSMISSDIDNDQDQDILYVSPNTSSEFNNGKLALLKFDSPTDAFEDEIILTKNLVTGIDDFETADIDNDGDLDLIISENNLGLIWINNNSNLGFEENKNLISSQHHSKIHTADLDNDGDIDLVLTREFGSSVVWFKNLDGLGDFSDEIIIQDSFGATNNVAYSVKTADIDNDGDLDVVASIIGSSKIRWYENVDGLGDFSQIHEITNIFQAYSIDLSDLDDDGDVDVVATGPQSDKVIWYENIDGNGAFNNGIEIIHNNPINSWYVHAINLDDDDDVDILVSSEGESDVIWFENLGNGLYSQEQIITNNMMLANPVDLDNDGDLDIVARTGGGSPENFNLFWLENLDNTNAFGNAELIINRNIDFIDIVDLNSDGRNDILTGLNISRSITELFWYQNLGALGNQINGRVTYDSNTNGCDLNDMPAFDILVSSTNGSNDFASFSQLNGNYQIALNEGNFITQIQNIPNYYSSHPISVNSNFVGLGNTESIDFCLIPTSILDDLNITIIPPTDEPRSGFDTSYQIIYSNIGTTQLSGDVTFQFDDSKIHFLNASETVASQTANSLTFNYSNLNPFETRTIDLNFSVFPPPTTNIDEILISTATINPTTGDETREDNTFTLEQTVIGSYDPNDIQILEGDQVHIDDADEYLHFLTRFQNTGTASAINVRVEHILDSKLDWTTMQLQSLSHEGRVEITDGSDVQFIFNNINLPNQASDEEGSIGYIAFKIKPKDDVILGDIISGAADIYFDFNPPIITNTANTEFVDNLGSDDFSLNEISVYPNPTNGLLKIKSSSIIKNVKVFDMLGRQLLTQGFNQTKVEFDLSALESGIYFIKMQSGNSTETRKVIKD